MKKSDPSKPLYVEIAMPLPVRHGFTYEVPPALSEAICPGQMVEAPLMRRKVQGIVLSVTSEKPDLAAAKIKKLNRLICPEYRLAPDLVNLGRWMSDYYLSGIGETLAAMTFFGLRDMAPKTRNVLFLRNPGLLEEGPGWSNLSSRQKEVALSFLEHGNLPVSRKELMEREKCSASVIKALLEKGILAEAQEEQEAPPSPKTDWTPEPRHPLTEEQEKCLKPLLDAVEEGKFQSFLLHGITGSGKTEIYLQAIERVMEKGREAIVLVPEIALTPQTLARFVKRFGPRVGVYHSRLTAREKYALWRRIRDGEIQVLLGARSALFAPFPRLGLIVVDEEHEGSYKQSDPAPRYHARDMAVWRARQRGVPVVLGSATPSLESLKNARDGKYQLLELTQRIGAGKLPEIQLIDMGREVQEGGHTGLLSRPLREAVQASLDRGEQVILFLNRRGFANFLFCHSCRKAVQCPHCDVVMTWHKQQQRLVCHYCGKKMLPPQVCPECGEKAPAPMGFGTQRIEEEVTATFPEARMLRVDLDTMQGRDAFHVFWEKMEGGQYDILLGTQMIAKGLHLEQVNLVGVVSADHALMLPDFRSAERAYSLMTQVAGRAGRMEGHGRVLVQTFIPHHYAIQRAVHHDHVGFMEKELHIREMLRFPPHYRLLLLRLSGLEEGKVRARAEHLGKLLRERAARNQRDYRQVSLLGPTPAPIGKLRDHYRWQLVIRGKEPARMRQLLLDVLEDFEKARKRTGVTLTPDMDPVDML